MSGTGSDDGFRPLTVVLMLAIGIVGFAATLLFGAYAPDLGGGRPAGTHALSDASIGYGGIVRLLDATGRRPHLVRDMREWQQEHLLIATPDHGFTDMTKFVGVRGGRVTLIVLPKWRAVKDKHHAGWVRVPGLLPAFDPAAIFAPGLRLAIVRHAVGGDPLPTDPDLPKGVRFRAPPRLQAIVGAAPLREGKPRLATLIGDGHGGVVLGQLDGGNLYLLADPDLLDNAGMNDLQTARSALTLIDWLNPTGTESIDFDVTLNGLAQTRNPLRLAFDPPFLAATLALVAVMLLLGVAAFGRFGAPRPPTRAIAFGKAALVDNAAAMVRKARRAHRLGGRYADLARERAARAFGAPQHLRGAALDGYLDRLGGKHRFSELARALDAAGDDGALVAAASAIHAWHEEKTA